MLGMQFAPKNLMAAIWLQFAQAIGGNKKFDRCAECQRPFEIGAETRAGSKYCRSACRSKAYRNRIGRAKELHKQGRSSKQIPSLLGSDSKTVKGWLSS
jgi:hypothetical protein